MLCCYVLLLSRWKRASLHGCQKRTETTINVQLFPCVSCTERHVIGDTSHASVNHALSRRFVVQYYLSLALSLSRLTN